MIIAKKPLLMESDFSMSFASLLNYEASKDLINKLITKAIGIKNSIFKKLEI